VTAATTAVSRSTTRDPGDALLAHVVAAATRDLVGPNGEPFEVEVGGNQLLGEAVLTYRLGSTVLAVRRLRVSERSRVVSLVGLELPVWWFDGTSIHEQFVANLSTGCLLSAVLSGSRSVAWAPYFDWARGMNNANAAALAAAVEAVTPAPGETAWGGNDLPARVVAVAGSWHQLIDSTTPAELVGLLEGVHPGLAQTVFIHLGAWYGERAVPQDQQ
jgi:hypothetical protein